MAGTIRPDTITVSTSSPLVSSKSLPSATPATKLASKPTVTAPRVDLEPLYTALKTAVGDADWAIYKEAISQFALGNLNQEELSQRIKPFISVDARRQHLHNQFICGIYANLFRDAPEPGVASWVSANDKPTVSAKQSTGDEAERRLKHEVMQLSRRERKRLKAIQESPHEIFNQTLSAYHAARTIKTQPTLPGAPSHPSSTTGYQKTNWDLEIRKRYTQPLFQETNEFPDVDSIAERMLPICYEEGLGGGYMTGCAEYMNMATETYIKEALSNFFARVSSNGDAFVRTANFKRQVEKEEEGVLRGEIVRLAGGVLPIEAEEARKRRPLCMEDLKLALELGDSYLGQVPLIAGKIANGKHLDGDAEEADAAAARKARMGVGLVNGTGPGLGRKDVGSGFRVEFGGGEAMEVDEEGAWQGGMVADVEALDGVLDSCLV